MSTIQQAAKRLEELRRAGVSIPWDTEDAATSVVPVDAGAAAPVQHPTPESEELSSARALPQPTADTETEDESGVDAPASTKTSEFARLDLVRLGQDGYLVPGHANLQLGEEFRVIKRPLIRNAQGKSAAPIHHANLIAVTSALAGEGKTFVATNLAMSIAMELDASALLIEADILRPAVMSRLGLEPRRGLIDVLTDSKIDLADVLLRTNINKLSLLPAGSRSLQTTELLASTRMGEFLDELATRYHDRIVVFDAPPLMMTSEARVLASRVGQVVVVAEAGRTSHAVFTQAMATIESCPVVMTILNKSKEPQSGLSYGYGAEAATQAAHAKEFSR